MYDHVAQRNVQYATATHTNRLLKNKIKKIIALGGHVIYHSRIVATEEIAFELEKRLIAKYGRRNNGTGILCNMTSGGEGVAGHVRSVQWRKASSDRQRLKAKSIDQYTKAGEYVRTWSHYKEACTELNVDSAGINRCCNQKLYSAGGFRWAWAGHPLMEWKRKPRGPGGRAGIQVHQFTLDGLYVGTHDSLLAAGRAVSKHPNTIGKCCAGKSQSAGGFRWSRNRDIFPNYTPTVFQHDSNGTLVNAHVSARAAAALTGINIGYIQRALRDRSAACGFYWTNAPAVVVPTKKTTGKRVQQLNHNGNIVATFPSCREAIRLAKIKGIYNCVVGLAKTAGGYAWRYV